MRLHREDLKEILKALESFPDVEVVDVQVDHSSGIGSTTTISFDTTVNQWNGKFTIEISGVENW